jgi:hypothetical protein
VCGAYEGDVPGSILFEEEISILVSIVLWSQMETGKK